MKPWILVPVAAAALGLFAFTSLRHQGCAARGPDDKRAPVDQSALLDDMDALKKKVARLENKPEARQVVLAAPVAAPEPQTPAEAEAAPAAPSPTPEEKLRAAARALDERLSREPIDVAWSRGAVRQIGEAIAANTSGTSVVSADCAASLCRVVVEHETEEAQRDVGGALVEVEPFRAGVFFDYDETAVPPVTTIYVIREGRSFREEPGDP